MRQTTVLLRRVVAAAILFGTAIGWTSPGAAFVQQLVIDQTATVNFSPIPLGSSTPGPSVSYTIYQGRVFGLLNPSSPLNSIITDINLAPTTGGLVAYVANFQIVTPTNPAARNGLMIHGVPNRGGNTIQTGNLIAGVTYVQSGWQGDLLSQCSPAVAISYPCFDLNSGPYGVLNTTTGAFTAPSVSDVTGSKTLAAYVVQIPVATTDHNPPNGTNTITGQVYGHVCIGTNGCGLPVGSNTSTAQLQIQAPAFVPYQPVSSDTHQAVLSTVTQQTFTGVTGAKTIIPSAKWAWAYCPAGWPGTPNPNYICLNGATFDPTKLYEVVYTAANPLVLGVGFAAFRDLGSFLKYGTTAPGGGSNPIAGSITSSMTVGSSQSGAFIHGLIFYGFNEDEGGRIVFDGAWPQVDGRMMVMNIRWGQPNNLMYLYMGGDEAPVWWADYPNLARNLPANGLLHRCSATGACPQVMETLGSAELYSEKMHVSLCGFTCVADIPLPSNVFRYYTPGSTHGSGTVSFNWTSPTSISIPAGQMLPNNPIPETFTNNALQYDFINWLLNGVSMPPSVYPTLAKGELVLNTAAAEGFPTTVPNLPFRGDQAWPPFVYDFGPGENYDQQSGIPTTQPPVITQVLPVYAAKVNADGNESVTGLPTVLGQAPLGTYVGWNLATTGWYGPNASNGPGSVGQVFAGAGNSGGFWPFWDTKAHRTSASDPRLSLEERYGTHAGYNCLVRQAANNAVEHLYLLQSDATTLINSANSGNVLSGLVPTAADLAQANNVMCGIHLTHDFNGDASSDLLWRDTGGDLALWLMSGATIQQAASLGTVSTTWSVVGTRDFNGDGMADILWRNANGDAAIWIMNGINVVSGSGLGNVPTNTSVVGLGDFNRDGTGDILWRDTSGNTTIWFMNNGKMSSSTNLGNVPLIWSVAGIGDFNGDGTSDILWRSAGGDLAIWMMNNGFIMQGVGVGNMPTNWSVVATGDFNNDGITDILWRNTTNGDILIWLMDNGGTLMKQQVIANLPTTWTVAQTGDFNNDGNSDIVWIDTSGNLMIWYMNGFAGSAVSIGNVGTAWAVQGVNSN